jgi:hypothetical protein
MTMSWASDELNAIHAGVAEDIRRRQERRAESIAEHRREEELSNDAASYAIRAAAEYVIRTVWPEHPLLTQPVLTRIGDAGRSEWRRTRDWKLVAQAGRDVKLPAFDYAKPFTRDLEHQVNRAEWLQSEAEKTAAGLRAENQRLQAQVAELQAKLDAATQGAEQLRAAAVRRYEGIEKDLASHMALEYAFRAALERAAPGSSLVTDLDTRTRLGRRGHEVYLATKDWSAVKDTGRSFVDYLNRDSSGGAAHEGFVEHEDAQYGDAMAESAAATLDEERTVSAAHAEASTDHQADAP